MIESNVFPVFNTFDNCNICIAEFKAVLNGN